jgi:ATP-binding cassette subfamily B protein
MISMANRTPLISGYASNNVHKEGPKSVEGAWRFIFQYLKNHKWLFMLAMALVCVESLLTAMAPDYISDMADLIADGLYTGEIDLEAVSYLGVIVFLLYLFGTLAMFLRNYWMADIAQYVARDMRRDLQAKMDRLPLRFYDTCRKGDVMSRFTNDADMVGMALNRSLAVFTHGIVLFFICIALMMLTNVTLAFVSMAAAFFGMGISAIVVRRTQKYYRHQQKNIGRMYGLISEMYSAHDVVLAYSASELNKEKFDEINESLRASGFRSEITMGLLPAIMSFVSNLGYVAVCIIGSVMVIEGQITIGVVVAFILYVKMFMGPLDMIANSLGNIQAAGAGAERINEFLSEEEMEPDISDERISEVKGRVEFEDIHFGYTPEAETIKGFSAVIEPGQKVAIVGSTGAGKTTTVNLLMRFYEIWSGDIRIDGISIRDMSRDNLRSLFCMVLQDAWLFEGTIRDNIAYCSDATDEDVREACEEVGLDMFIDSLPDGLDTRIGSKSTLSEGQKQQICIARALVTRAPMLILDEATSSVDTRTEVVIQRAIDSMMGGRTSFVIAHRLSTIRDADVILVMKDGNIVEKGTHEGLLKNNGVYADLYHSQFEQGE